MKFACKAAKSPKKSSKSQKSSFFEHVLSVLTSKRLHEQL